MKTNHAPGPTLAQRVTTSVVLGLLVLPASAVSLLGSLRVAPVVAYEAPPVDTSRVSEPLPEPTVESLGPHLYQVGELTVVHVWGSPREMGRQHGEAVAEAVKGVQETYLKASVTEGKGYSVEYQLECAEAMLRHIPEDYIEEMHGVAEGAGVPYEDILLLHTHADTVHFGKGWSKIGATTQARRSTDAWLCSNFVAVGEATADGHTIHGRNLDWTIKTGVQEHAILLIAEPDGGVPFALLTYAGGIGGVTGMNAEGITFGEMTSQTNHETLDGLPLFLVCRTILQTCHDLDEVEQFVTTYPGTTGWNFMIADGEAGDARAFEVDAVHREVFGLGDPSEDDAPVSNAIPNAIRRTNHPISRSMQKSVAARLELPSVELARIAVPTLDTWQRYSALGTWIAEDHFGEVDPTLARAILQSHPVAAGNTLHSAVFDATDTVMWVANASAERPAWDRPYARVDLREWVGRDR